MDKLDLRRRLFPASPGRQSIASQEFGIGVGLLPGSAERIVGASATVQGTVGGLAHRSAASAAGIVRKLVPGMGNVVNQYIGFLTTFRTTTTTANAVVGSLGSPNGSSGNTLFNAYLTGASNVDCTLAFGNGTTNQTLVASSVGLNDGRIHTLLAIAGPFTSVSGTVVGHIYLDGRSVFKTSVGGVALGVTSIYDSVLSGGFRRGGTDGVYTTQGDVDNLAIFPILRWEMPSDAEALAISRSPAAFIFPRRIIVPVSAGGAVPTITALSARLITASSAQPRISYS